MGRDKALLELSGVPLALRIAGELRKVCESVRLVGDPESHAVLGLPVVRDNFPGHGPLAGIEAALGSTDTDWNLIVACDMPALDTATLEALFPAAGDCSLPRYANGKVEPLCAVYHRRCHPAILAALKKGIRKVTDALETLELTYIPVASTAPFANLNTPEDVTKYTHG
jgi:molybdenum cofactor guanylyltransferase